MRTAQDICALDRDFALIEGHLSNLAVTGTFSGDSGYSTQQPNMTGPITGTHSLCTACTGQGLYHIHWSFFQSGSPCTSQGGGVTLQVTWTDGSSTHTATLPMVDASSLTIPGGVFHFQTNLSAAWASGDFNVYISTGPINYTTGYTSCPGGGTYNFYATVTQLQ